MRSTRRGAHSPASQKSAKRVSWRQVMAPKYLLEDWRANRGHPKEQALLASLRIAQAARRRSRPLGILATVLHRLLSELLLNIELRPETSVGPGLRLFHGVAL